MLSRSTCACLLIAFLSLFNIPAVYAQLPAYGQFEVDSVAAPQGGIAMLETFLAVNLQKPFMAQVANATGKVFIKAVVEPNGYVSDVALVRGFRPDCDREALRVMRLFNAWKPAQKGGQRVRQVITYPVVFRANAPITYESGKTLTYYDTKFSPVSNASTASYLQAFPVDTLTGLPNGDLVFYEISKGVRGREVNRFPLVRQQITPKKSTEAPTYLVGHKQKTSDWIGLIHTLSADGAGHATVHWRFFLSGHWGSVKI